MFPCDDRFVIRHDAGSKYGWCMASMLSGAVSVVNEYTLTVIDSIEIFVVVCYI